MAFKSGDKEIMDDLKEISFGADETISDEDIVEYARMAGITPAEIITKLDKGWKPPKLRR